MILTALTSSLLVFGILFSVGTLQKSDAASADYYLEIEGVKGESHITNCPDCMKISSWSWGTINSDYAGDVISQLEVQGQIPKEFNFTKVTSSASPKLFEAALVGNHFKTGKLWGFEIKYTDAPTLTPSMRSALKELSLAHLWVISPGKENYALDKKVSVISIQNLDKIGVHYS